MTVTYARQRPRPGGGNDGSPAGGSQRYARRCRRCRTRYVVEVHVYDRITIDVDGPACGACDPAATGTQPKPPGPPSPPERVFKVWLASKDRSAPRVEVRDLARGADVAPRIELNPARREPVGFGREARTALAALVRQKIGEQDFEVIRPAWREEHCDIFAQLAEALERAWSAARSRSTEAYRVVVRLAPMPELANVTVAEMVARSLEAHYRTPLLSIADDLRRAGVAWCASTEEAATCAALASVLHPPDIPGVVRRPVLVASAEPSELTEPQRTIVGVVKQLDLVPLREGSNMPRLADAVGHLTAPTVSLADRPDQAVDVPVVVPEATGLPATVERLATVRAAETAARPMTFGDPGR
jgi:hypothetical protein